MGMHDSLGRRRRSGGVVKCYWVPLGFGSDPLETRIAFRYKALVGVKDVFWGSVLVLRDCIVVDKDEMRARGICGE